MDKTLLIAIVGAESTGKTMLAQALAARIAQLTGLRTAWVPEVLRAWCNEHGRTPRADEQHGIAGAQTAAIEHAATHNEVLVCDTTPLMTAVYSRLLFHDTSLDVAAVRAHRGMALTLLTALDIEWASDGLQRDGPQVRAPVDACLRELMAANGIGFTVVSGQGQARVDTALSAVKTLLLAYNRGTP